MHSTHRGATGTVKLGFFLCLSLSLCECMCVCVKQWLSDCRDKSVEQLLEGTAMRRILQLNGAITSNKYTDTIQTELRVIYVLIKQNPTTV